jgi:asparagine synthase (glutamine-hydrolysing)
VIDLSPTGTQPMSNEDETIWTVFNGEIYNHHELRGYLKARGHVFKGTSDTEILPHLYEEKGPAFVGELRGMFALAVYDSITRTMVLARDRFGIKPLFYAPGKNRFAFASEIRALLLLPGVDARFDRQAIHDFAALFYIPGPETLYEGIRAVKPGEIVIVRFDDHGITYHSRKYYDWSINPDYNMTISNAVEHAEGLLTAAVKKQLQSDVPLGSLLSGGIDSSLVSAAAQAALGGSLETFNVKFPDNEYDETWAAVAVANHIGSHHQTLDLEYSRGTWENVTTLLLHGGQPFADTSLFAVNAICKMMRPYVTVALSGDGGDEAFGGYDFYAQIARIFQWQHLPKPVQWGALGSLGSFSRLGLFPERLLERIRDLDTDDNTRIIQSLFCWIREDEHRSICHDTNLLPVRRLFEPQWEYHLKPHASRLERLAAHTAEVNVRLMLPDDFLFKVDIASMKESLEIRVPMLDEALFEFGLSLPYRLKVKGRRCKRVLREIARLWLPLRVAQKRKWGFGIPFDRWVDADFKTRLRETLLGMSTRISEFFRPESYAPVIKAFCDDGICPGTSRQGLAQRTIMFLSLELALSRKP